MRVNARTWAGSGTPCTTCTAGASARSSRSVTTSDALSNTTSHPSTASAAAAANRRSADGSPMGSGRWSSGATASTPGTPEPCPATSVTRCPRRARPAATRATTRSVPPYAGGGVGSQGGATIPIRRRTVSRLATRPAWM